MITNENGFFEVRLESIGGLGANIAGKMLAEAAVLYQGLNGSAFSSYGSEKKGSPVKSFVRLCGADHALRDASPVVSPFVVGIFHEMLIKTEPVTAGLRPSGTAIVNTTESAQAMASKLCRTSGRVAVVDALKIAVEEKTRVNTAMLGAIARLCEFLDPDAIKKVIRETFDHKYPQMVESNLRTFDRGFNEVQILELGPGSEASVCEAPKAGPAFGYLAAPIGGIIPNPGNTVLKDLTASRQGFLPAFLRDKCIDCGQCDLVCPDFCFVWEKGVDKKGQPAQVLLGIDYRYCKGCLKCVVACPTDALVEHREEPGYADAHRVPHDLTGGKPAKSA